MLPPSQFGNGHGSDWEHFENKEAFDYNEDRYELVRGAIEHWSDGSGFDIDTWLEGITELKNYEVYVDDYGNIHVDFSFDFDIGGGDYTGTRSVSYSF